MCGFIAFLIWITIGYMFMFLTRLFYRLRIVYCKLNTNRYDDPIEKLVIGDFYEPALLVGCIAGFFMVPICVGMLIVFGVTYAWKKITDKYNIDHNTVLWK